MRDLERNKQYIYYSLYNGKTPVMVDGKKTGEWEISYSPACEFRISVSPSKGEAFSEIFGVDTNYTHIMSTCSYLPIDEHSIIWYGFGKVCLYRNCALYKVGELCLHNGFIKRCIRAINVSKPFDTNDWEDVPNNYVVVRKAKSINSTLYAIREVDIRD